LAFVRALGWGQQQVLERQQQEPARALRWVLQQAQARHLRGPGLALLGQVRVRQGPALGLAQVHPPH